MGKKQLKHGCQVFVDLKHSAKFIRILKTGMIEVEIYGAIKEYIPARITK